MNFKIINKEKCIKELTLDGYESIFDSLSFYTFDGDKHLEVPLIGEDTVVSLTLLSFSGTDAEYIYNGIV